MLDDTRSARPSGGQTAIVTGATGAIGAATARLLAQKGAKVVIGQIEVRPIRVEKRQLHLSMEGTDEREKKQFSRTQPALVMTLDIKNNGDLPIFPMDPAFTRRASGADKPLTRLVIGPKVYAGGESEAIMGRVLRQLGGGHCRPVFQRFQHAAAREQPVTACLIARERTNLLHDVLGSRRI